MSDREEPISGICFVEVLESCSISPSVQKIDHIVAKMSFFGLNCQLQSAPIP